YHWAAEKPSPFVSGGGLRGRRPNDVGPNSKKPHSCTASRATRHQWIGSTTPTLLTPLHARYTRPSDVAAMFRTVPPPEGISARANSSVFGLNRTTVFGVTPDSLYHTIPSGVMVIP